LIAIVACIHGVGYLIGQGVSGELALVRIPPENRDLDGNIISLEGLEPVRPQDVVRNASSWSFRLPNFSKMISDRLGMPVLNPEGMQPAEQIALEAPEQKQEGDLVDVPLYRR